MNSEKFMEEVIKHELTVEETVKFLEILKNNNLYKGE